MYKRRRYFENPSARRGMGGLPGGKLFQVAGRLGRVRLCLGIASLCFYFTPCIYAFQDELWLRNKIVAEPDPEPADIEMEENPMALKASKDAEAGGSTYRADDLWVPAPGRPVFGGQLFAQSLFAALDREPNALPYEATGSFVYKVEKDKGAVKYVVGSRDESNDKSSFFSRDVSGYQGVDNTLCTNIKVRFAANNGPRQELVSYDKSNGVKLPAFEEMLTLEEYHREVHGEEAEVERRTAEYKKRCPGLEVKFGRSEDPHGPERLVAMRVLHPSSFAADDVRIRYCLVAFLSDLFLLETAIIMKKEDIFSGKRNILSMTHTISFTGLSHLDVYKPIYYKMEVLTTGPGNMPLCAGALMQSGRTLAYAIQKGLVARGGGVG